MNNNLIFGAVLGLGLAGCAETVPVTSAPMQVNAAAISQAHAIAAYDLFDPSSAQFRGDRMYKLSSGDYVVCGEMNGKNQLGGYVGFTPYYVRMAYARGQATKKVMQIDFMASDGCRQAASGTVDVLAE